MIRILLDQGLPRSTPALLRQAGWDVQHVVEIGMSQATDLEIILQAREDHRIICTLDADFHSLLAVSGQAKPSVIRIRREGLRAQALSDLLLSIWPRIGPAADEGALIIVTEKSIRMRRLPIGTRGASG